MAEKRVESQDYSPDCPPQAKRSESGTPISMTSSSSEDEVCSSYDIVKSRSKSQGLKSSSIPEIDPNIISDLEEQAKIAAKSLSNMTNQLTSQLSDMTHVTKETVSMYAVGVEDIGLSVETNIRTMYGLMAKCEELNRKMKPVYEIEGQVQEIKSQLEILESMCK